MASWVLQELAQRGDVTLLTLDAVDIDLLDEFWGTSLAEAPISALTVRSGLYDFFKRREIPCRRFELHALSRAVRKIRHQYRYVLVLKNELDLGGPGLQLVYFPNYSLGLLVEDIKNQSTLLTRMLGWMNLAFCQAVSWWSDRRVARNFTMAISGYVGRVFWENYGKEAEVIVFPPPIAASVVASANRQSAFLGIGRIAPEKKWEDAIEIVGGLRGKHHDVALTLVGSVTDEEYYRALMTEYGELPWLSIRTELSRADLEKEIAAHQFGIHTLPGEHYGMAVAELVLGGCLTAVHDSGGQIEIVTEPEVRFSDNADAVEKLDRVLSDEELFERLLTSQQSRKEMYTLDGFKKGLAESLDLFENAYSVCKSASDSLP